METVRVKLSEGGWIVIPAEYCKQLGLQIGDDVVLRLDNETGEVRLYSVAAGIRRAQELVRKSIPEERNLSDELIAERRAEAARE